MACLVTSAAGRSPKAGPDGRCRWEWRRRGSRVGARGGQPLRRRPGRVSGRHAPPPAPPFRRRVRRSWRYPTASDSRSPPALPWRPLAGADRQSGLHDSTRRRCACAAMGRIVMRGVVRRRVCRVAGRSAASPGAHCPPSMLTGLAPPG